MPEPSVDILTANALARPTKLALVDDRGAGDATVALLTYAELEDAANRLSHVLLGSGVGAGDRVVWCGPNSIGVVTLINAARKIGATAVPLNYRLSDDEAAFVTDHCDASVVYVDAEYAALFERIRDRVPGVATILVFDGPPPAGMEACDDHLAASPSSAPHTAGAVEPGATMIYTSGTTGRPKGVIKDSSTRPDRAGGLLDAIGYTSDDVYLTTGPLYHSGPGGFMGIAQTLGQTVVLQRRFDAEDWLRLVEAHGCTSTFAAPTPIRKVLDLPTEVKARYDLSSMRAMIANAAPWSFSLKQRYLDDFPSDSLFEVYGSTELGVNTLLRPEDQLRKPGSCGRPAPGVEIRLYDADGSVVTASGPGAVGEVYVRGLSVFSAYHKQRDRFDEDEREGFHTVGDIAWRDDEGFVYICDRKKDMIISGGMNIYPAEVESVLEAHPAVVETAVFGIPDDEWGERVHAAIVRRPGVELDAAAVESYARDHLAGYKIPRSISWVDELPKTGSGKILKRELRQPYWAEHGANV